MVGGVVGTPPGCAVHTLKTCSIWLYYIHYMLWCGAVAGAGLYKEV